MKCPPIAPRKSKILIYIFGQEIPDSPLSKLMPRHLVVNHEKVQKAKSGPGRVVKNREKKSWKRWPQNQRSKRTKLAFYASENSAGWCPLKVRSNCESISSQIGSEKLTARFLLKWLGQGGATKFFAAASALFLTSFEIINAFLSSSGVRNQIFWKLIPDPWISKPISIQSFIF